MTNLSYDTPITMLNLMNHNAGFQEVIAIIMSAMCVYGLIRNNKSDIQPLKVRQRVFNNITVIFLLAAVTNVLYWNLFMFWAV